MKKILVLSAAVLMALAANAKIWRINPNEAALADFQSLDEACEADQVEKFDTLYCEPGTYPNYQTVTKQCLTILGPGWEIPTNFGSTSTFGTAYFADALRLSADSLTIAGLQVTSIQLYNKSLRDITIERCKIGILYTQNIGYSDVIKNITIRNNYFTTKLYADRRPITLDYGNSLLNISIENNIIIDHRPADTWGDLGDVITLIAYYEANTSGTIAHNTIVGFAGYYQSNSFINARRAVIRDNILINKATTEDSWKKYALYYDKVQTCEVYNNVLSVTDENASAEMKLYFPNNHYIGATIANTFTQTIVGNAEETFFQLKDGSVAAGKAYSGEDCGAFAGGWPFIVQGRPMGIPYIYDVQVPNTVSGDEMSISFKVKANNQ